ncbi:hypothetical protein GCM10022236_32530 [Microlunatus ginsengisoli]|uniref:Uncharacterized protein n=2 Tax=Microlunatus ginsengisoli TaxID=363863 RepID=A0ABP7A9U9_9ACTN
MNAGSQAAGLDSGRRALAERAASILRDEIANGALANINAASQGWSAHRGGVATSEMTRRLESEFVGLRNAVLDLIAPPSREIAGSAAPRNSPWLDHAAGRSPSETVPLPVLRAVRSVPPGSTAEIRTGLRNDGPELAQIGFGWSDLVADPDGVIPASCLRLLPGRVHVPAGGVLNLVIGLDVPGDAQPGLYRTLLEATEPLGLRALLMFPVGAP